MNCSEIPGATSSVFVHPLFAFCRHSPQLILRYYYVRRLGHLCKFWVIGTLREQFRGQK
jgi:hypothetical protein